MSRNARMLAMGIAVLAAAIPLTMGQGCPSSGLLGTLLQPGGLLADGVPSALLDQSFTTTPFTATFSPTETGKTITVIVTADSTDSRPAFTVTDPSGAVVAEVTAPSAPIEIATFTSASTDAHTVVVTEAGSAATQYHISVLQPGSGGWTPPRGPHMDGFNDHGIWGDDDMWGTGDDDHNDLPGPSIILRQIFTAAPFTATFSVVDTTAAVHVGVAGNNADSRPAFTVLDESGATVAEVANPNDNISTTSFTPTAAGTFTVNVTEQGTAATLYGLRVRQIAATSQPSSQPGDDEDDDNGMGMGHGRHGGRGPAVLLQQNSSSAPLTATFQPRYADIPVFILVVGDNEGSRVSLTVTDGSGTEVVAPTTPTTNVSHVTFTPADTGTYTIAGAETGTAASLYRIKVIQPPRHLPQSRPEDDGNDELNDRRGGHRSDN